MQLLSLHEDTNSSLALFEDGRLVFAAAEERLTRNKFQEGYPRRCVDYVRKRYGTDPASCDVLAAGNPHHFLSRLPGVLPSGEHDLFGPLQKAYLSFQDLLPGSDALRWATRKVSDAANLLAHRRVPWYVDHHTAHAYSAYIASGFGEALTVSADNMGDGFAAKVFDCTGGRCKELYGSTAVKSPGQFYGEIAQLLGFHLLMAGKVTGLAAYGDWRPAYPIVSKLFSLAREGTDFEVYPLWRRGRNRGIFAQLSRFSPAEIAAATQRRFEDVMVGYVRQALLATKRRHLALAGGIFGNVKLNQRLMELPEVDEVVVHPAMSDQGIAVGAAYHYLAHNLPGGYLPERLPHVFLGPEYSEEEMGRALDRAGVTCSRPRDLEAAVVEKLLDGKAVARFSGALEYGPRALGHRTLMYRPDDPSVNDWLNRRLNRSEFMPFAPVTLDEHAEHCYLQVEKARYAARFMTMCFDCTPQMKRASAGVVHIDGTARPQLIDEATDPAYYRIVRLFYEKTGNPSLINTSFNMHGEPIVCSPDDALRAFIEGNIDYLALGPFLARSPAMAE